MRNMLQVPLGNRKPCLPHNINRPAQHLFCCAEGLLQLKPFRLRKLSLRHPLYVMCCDVKLPAENPILPEGYFSRFHLNRQLGRPIIREKYCLFSILPTAPGNLRTGLSFFLQLCYYELICFVLIQNSRIQFLFLQQF